MEEIEFEVNPTEKELAHLKEMISRFVETDNPLCGLLMPKIFLRIVGLYFSANIPIEGFLKDAAIMYTMAKRCLDKVVKEEGKTDDL